MGAKILAALENSAQNGDLRATYLCDLAIRKFERVAISREGDLELTSAIGGVLATLEAIGHPLSNEDREVLRQIFKQNGFNWSGDSS